MEEQNLKNGYYKIDLYNSNGDHISNDSEKVDYIVVEVKDNIIREVVFNKNVTFAYYNKELDKNVFDEKQYSKIQQDQYLLGMAPYIRTTDLNKENEIFYDKKLGYNKELSEYYDSLEHRFFTTYLDKKQQRINENYSNQNNK